MSSATETTEFAQIVVAGTCYDCGPYCSRRCACRRNAADTRTEPVSRAYLENWLGPNAILSCRNCGDVLFDEDDEDDAAGDNING